jgi:hypothetical protein
MQQKLRQLLLEFVERQMKSPRRLGRRQQTRLNRKANAIRPRNMGLFANHRPTPQKIKPGCPRATFALWTGGTARGLTGAGDRKGLPPVSDLHIPRCRAAIAGGAGMVLEQA